MSNKTVRISAPLDATTQQIVDYLKLQVASRTYRASNELRNAALLVLRGQRHGRRYKVPGTYRLQLDKATGKKRYGRYYTASAPGEPPAVRTGVFRLSWQTNPRIEDGKYTAAIESAAKTDGGNHVLGEILENGTSRMAPRPYMDAVKEKAEKNIVRIYSQPYNL